MVSILDQAIGGIASVFNEGNLVEDAVTVRVGTRIYNTWEEIRITRNLDSLASGFSLSMVDKWRELGELWPLIPGELLRANIGAIPIINGFIDKLEVSVSNEDRFVSISGRDKTGDLVDSSVIGKNEFGNIDIEQLAIALLSPFGIDVDVDPNTDIGDTFDRHTIKQGETVFETLEKAAKLRGLLLTSDQNGNLVITNRAGVAAADFPSVSNLKVAADFVAGATAKAGLSKSSVDLVQGENILEARAIYDNNERFREYIVKGQSPGDDFFFGPNATEPVGRATDLGIERTRSLVVLAEGNVNQKTAQKRANWEATVRAAKSLEVLVKVQGWLKPDRSLWRPNELVRLNARFIGLDSEMLISRVTYSKDKESGTIANITLTRPDAYNLKEEIKKEDDPFFDLGHKPNIVSEVVKKISNVIGK